MLDSNLNCYFFRSNQTDPEADPEATSRVGSSFWGSSSTQRRQCKIFIKISYSCTNFDIFLFILKKKELLHKLFSFSGKFALTEVLETNLIGLKTHKLKVAKDNFTI